MYSAPSSTGGSTTYRVVCLNTDNSAAIKAKPGKVLGWDIGNAVASVRYVKLYNQVAAPASTDTPLLTIVVPASSHAYMPPSDYGPQFDTGIGIRITTGAGDSDNTAPSAADVIAHIFYA